MLILEPNRPMYRQKMPWTMKEIELLKTWWKKGISIQAIAKLLGRTPKAVAMQRLYLDLPPRYMAWKTREIDLVRQYDNPKDLYPLFPNRSRVSVYCRWYDIHVRKGEKHVEF